MMRPIKLVAASLALAFAVISFTASAARAGGQSGAGQTGPKATADQQKQIDRLRQLDQQLEEDRDALHQAIAKYGWDSDQADAAQEALSRDRVEYRKLRRSLAAAGAAVPPLSAFGAGMGPRRGRGMGPGQGRGTGEMRGAYSRQAGQGCGCCRGGCCDW